MRAFPPSLRFLLQQEALPEGQLDTLVETQTDPPIRRALSKEKAIEWPSNSGNTFYADAGAFSISSDNLDAKRPQVTLELQNVRDPEDESAELHWAELLNSVDLNGTRVLLRYVGTETGDPTAEALDAGWTISGVNSVGHDRVVFHLGSPHDSRAAVVPRVSIGARKCMAFYGKGFCTSVSTLATCPKTWQACTERYPGNQVRRYGPGFPLYTDPRRRGVS